MEAQISYETIEAAAEAFVKRSIVGIKRDTIVNLIIGKKYNTSHSLLGRLKESALKGESITMDVFEREVKNTVSSYSNNKDNAIDIIKRFQLELQKKYDFQTEINYPPIPVSNTFERLMYISKYLQNPNHAISDLQEILWVSSRTIEEDLAKLRGYDDDPIQICGRPYLIKDMTRRDDKITDMASTPHPFFLTCNLTEVITMLRGLKKMGEEASYKAYSIKTAVSIWEQLSDYAKDRILYVSKELIPDDLEWYKQLDSISAEAFWPEYQCSSFGENAMLDCLKNGKTCFVEYATEHGTNLYKDVKVKKLMGTEFLVEIEGEEMLLEGSKILKSASSLDMIF